MKRAPSLLGIFAKHFLSDEDATLSLRPTNALHGGNAVLKERGNIGLRENALVDERAHQAVDKGESEKG